MAISFSDEMATRPVVTRHDNVTLLNALILGAKLGIKKDNLWLRNLFFVAVLFLAVKMLLFD